MSQNKLIRPILVERNYFKSAVRLIAKWSLKLARSVNTERRQHQFLVFSEELVSDEILVCGHFDYKELTVIEGVCKQYFEPEKKLIFFDIGANIGNHAVKLADFFSKIYCFEPDPLNFKVLEINTADFDNVEVFNKGLSNRDGSIELSINGNNRGQTRAGVTKGIGKPNQGVRAEVTTLDKFCNGTGIYPNVIKIDVEGMELEVIKGALNTIIKFSPIIFFESLPSLDIAKCQEVTSLLINCGFKIASFKTVSSIFNLQSAQVELDFEANVLGMDFPLLVAIPSNKFSS